MIGGSLKQLGRRPRLHINVRRFPRSNDRGLIEAICCSPLCSPRKRGFPDQMIGASLKRSGSCRAEPFGYAFPRSNDRGLIEASKPHLLEKTSGTVVSPIK